MASSSCGFCLSSFPYKFSTLASFFNSSDSISWLLAALGRWSNLYKLPIAGSATEPVSHFWKAASTDYIITGRRLSIMVEVILIWHSPQRFFSMAIQGFFPGSAVHIMNSGLHSRPNSHTRDVQKLQWVHSDGFLPEGTRDNEDWEQQSKQWATANGLFLVKSEFNCCSLPLIYPAKTRLGSW